MTDIIIGFRVLTLKVVGNNNFCTLEFFDKILQSIVEHSNVLNNLIADDVLLLDRRICDCVDLLNEKGFDVKMPPLLQSSQNEQRQIVMASKRATDILEQFSKYFNKNGTPLHFHI